VELVQNAQEPANSPGSSRTQLHTLSWTSLRHLLVAPAVCRAWSPHHQ